MSIVDFEQVHADWNNVAGGVRSILEEFGNTLKEFGDE